ncbi:MAG: FtsX-like permease family protein [Lachnospiraceae bacterium]|nr:FtsX-like permease family protein [Lachnospiraceae bacterium]
MKQTFWAKIAFKNIIENIKFHLANMIVSVFTIMSFYIFTFTATNKGLAAVKGYSGLKFILMVGCVFLALISFVFKAYTNRLLIKRRNKELGLYAAWGLEPKHINSILFYESLYIYSAYAVIGIGLGVLLQKYIYQVMFKLMHCDVKYAGGFTFDNIFISLGVFAVIDLFILLKNMISTSKKKIITLLKEEAAVEPVKKLRVGDILKGIVGVALIVCAYIYVNSVDDFVNSIRTLVFAIALLFAGSFLAISSFVVMIELALKKQDKLYYKNTFFTTLAKLVSRTKNNALSLAVINILFTCVIVGSASTIALYLGTERQASVAFKTDGEISLTDENKIPAVLEAINSAADETGLKVEGIWSAKRYAFQTTFNEQSGEFNNEHFTGRNLPDIIEMMTVETFNENEGTDYALKEGEILFISDEECPVKSLEEVNIYGNRFKVAQIVDGPIFTDIDNIQYAYKFHVIVDNDETLARIRESLVAQGNTREFRFSVTYNVAGTKDEELRFDEKLIEKVMRIDSVDYMDSNATQRQTRYARNSIFLFLGTFISLIFIMYMIFIMYYKQIEEALDDVENVKIMKKIGMYGTEIKKCIFAENGILFFLPVIMAFCHVAACFNLMKDVMKLFMLTDMDFIRLCVVLFCLGILVVYMLMYYGAYKVYTGIVLKEDSSAS